MSIGGCVFYTFASCACGTRKRRRRREPLPKTSSFSLEKIFFLPKKKIMLKYRDIFSATKFSLFCLYAILKKNNREKWSFWPPFQKEIFQKFSKSAFLCKWEGKIFGIFSKKWIFFSFPEFCKFWKKWFPEIALLRAYSGFF